MEYNFFIRKNGGKLSIFITFEGIEGCGKTTQIGLLTAVFEKSKRSFLLTREPGGTEAGERIREILLSSKKIRLDPMAELLLYAAARIQHYIEVIQPALREGKIVLCDRFADATLAYQGFGRGLDIDWIEEIHRRAINNLKPDITFLLDLPVEEGLRRAWIRIKNSKGIRTQKINPDYYQLEFPFHLIHADQDRFEKEAIDFHQKVREGYLTLARQEPGRIIILDGMKDEQTLH
ncbi:MAG: dTMP kinase, partial [Planctomycetaceae bacterium]